MSRDKQNSKYEFTNSDRYQSSYSDESLFVALSKYAKKLGKDAAENALLLYYTLKDDTDWADKALIIGALGYLIVPFDLIPDFIPGGLVDDIGVLASVVMSISACITPEIRSKAKKILKKYFD